MSTAASIVDAMTDELESLTPTVQANYKFRPHREEQDIRTFVELNPQGSFRLFSIVDSGEVEGPDVSNMDDEQVRTRIEVVIAYPLDFRYGPQMAKDRRDVMESDEKQIKHTIGIDGYANLDVSAGGDATVFGQSVTRERVGNCEVTSLMLDVMYYRTNP